MVVGLLDLWGGGEIYYTPVQNRVKSDDPVLSLACPYLVVQAM